jgi:hypothetical protein
MAGRRIRASVVAAGPQSALGEVVSPSSQHSDRGHDVSILMAMIGPVGRWRGVEPRSKVSIVIMRPPQHGLAHAPIFRRHAQGLAERLSCRSLCRREAAHCNAESK